MTHRRLLVRLRMRVEEGTVMGIGSCLRALPRSWAHALGRTLGGMSELWLVSHRKRAQSQLRGALDLTESEAQRTTTLMFRELGARAVELIRTDEAEAYRRMHLATAARQVLDGVRARRKGALIVAGHLGPWEVMAARLAREFPVAAVVVGAHPHPPIQRWLVRRRESMGIRTIIRGRWETPFRIRATLSAGGAVGALLDQSTRVPSVAVPFFGRPAPTPTGMVSWAQRFEVPLLMAWPVDGPEAGAEIIHLSPIPSSDPFEALVRVQGILEREVRRAPHRWVWLHNRWSPR
ncbi:MAG: lysophospholipid acyltransferase family protein [Myxococcota bacterium]